MTYYKSKNKDLKEKVIPDRIDITDYVRTAILELEANGYKYDLRQPPYVHELQKLLNDPVNTTFKSLRDIRSGIPFWNKQEVEFVLSNLGTGRGALFYFVCNECRGRVKYLYTDSLCSSPVCRKCAKLGYRNYPKKARQVARLLMQNSLSSEDRQFLIKLTGITSADFVV
jgi:hypothetical protein